MKKVTAWIMPIALVLNLTACDGQKKNTSSQSHTDSTAHQHHEGMAMGQQPSTVIIKDDKLNAVYQHYVHLTTALVNSDASEAKIASSAIEAGMNQLANGSTVATTAAKISQAKDIEEQRKLYSTLSDEFIPLVKKAGLTSGELYVDFCPMANNDKGAYWLSAQKDIKNPYFGEKMLTCGEVKETVK